jgi:hypothetical protein
LTATVERRLMVGMVTRVWKFLGFALPAFALALVIALGGGRASADDKNKCGCYRDSAGTCFCDKKAKCGCPGECEPKGCEEAREKQIQREIEAETKKAASRERSSKASSDSEKGESEKESKKADSEAAPASGKKLTAAQTKQLAKLIDAYLAAHPDGGNKTMADVRSELK